MIGVRPLWLVIPAFNAAGTVARAVGGRVHLPGVGRVVVVDDGSTDGTAETARAAGADVIAQANAGPSAARNAALDAAAAAGADVLLLDADDELLPACVERLSAAMDRRPGARVAIAAFRRVLPGGREDDRLEPVWSVLERMGGSPSAALLPDCPLSASGLYLPHKTLESGARFDTSLRTHEDRDFVYRAARDGPLACTDAPAILKHEGHGQMTGDPGLAGVFLSDCLAFLERHREAIPPGNDSRLGAALRHYLKRYAKASLRLRRPIDRALWKRAVERLRSLNERPGWRTRRYQLLASAATVLRVF